MPPRHLGLFSGIGGFEVAAAWAGFETVGMVEIDPRCQRVLRANFPAVPVHDDVHTLTADTFGTHPIDLITGGFPCQPVSVGGYRKGDQDDRWLWPAMRRVVNAYRPPWVAIENVRGLLSLGHDEVCADLEADGYQVETLVLSAVGINAPHRRERVFVVAHAPRRRDRAGRRGTDPLAAPDGAGGGDHRGGGVSDSGQEPVRRARQDSRPPQPDDPRATPREREAPAELEVRLPADGVSAYLARPHVAFWDGDWETVPRTAIEDAGRKQRLHALGNAIVPQVAYVVLDAIATLIEAEDEHA